MHVDVGQWGRSTVRDDGRQPRQELELSDVIRLIATKKDVLKDEENL